ncbi:MAG: cupin domain-containing protein [Thermodesulfovibrionia bacterium]|nr:cupin domain-containing protein [Thermodesulfovibrionia bacterium]
MKLKTVTKVWGHEVWVVNAEQAGYCGKILFVRGTWSSSGRYHYHLLKDETFYVISGVLILDIHQGKRHRIAPGGSLRVRPNIPHRFKADANMTCTFIEFSTYHRDSDSYYL